LFDEEHEKDLEDRINLFLEVIPDQKIVDIKFSIAAITEPMEDEQIYCYSAMILYRK
jgi:hypothetical protein